MHTFKRISKDEHVSRITCIKYVEVIFLQRILIVILWITAEMRLCVKVHDGIGDSGYAVIPRRVNSVKMCF